MASRYALATALVAIILSSSSLFAAQLSTVEISSTSKRQSRPEVSCELKIKERYEYYDVVGSSIADLRRQIKQNGTRWNDGKTYAAVTSWDIKYGYDVVNEGGSCSVQSVKTDVEIVYHLPRMISSSGLDLTGLWNGYLAHVKLHEYGHKDIAVKAAGEINEALASLPKFKSEQELEKEASRVADEKLQRMTKAQVAYDADTRHGETQGAVLAAK